jgi:hypothetical protein
MEQEVAPPQAALVAMEQEVAPLVTAVFHCTPGALSPSCSPGMHVP